MKIFWQIKKRFCEETTYKLGLEVQAGEKRPVQKNRHLKEDTHGRGWAMGPQETTARDETRICWGCATKQF